MSKCSRKNFVATGGRPQEFSSAILKGKATKEVRKNQHLDFTQNPELTKEDDIMWQIGQLQLKSTEFEKFSEQLFPVMQALQEATIKYPEIREDTDAFLTTVGLYHIVAKGGSREEVAQNPLFLRGKELFKNMFIERSGNMANKKNRKVHLICRT